MKIKSFLIKGEPTSKSRKDLAANVDADVNAFLEKNKGISVKNVVVSANTALSFPEAFIIISYEDK